MVSALLAAISCPVCRKVSDLTGSAESLPINMEVMRTIRQATLPSTLP